MTAYNPPLDDLSFLFKDYGYLEQLAQLPGLEDLEASELLSIFEQAGEFASDILAKTNWPGDRHGVIDDNGTVKVAPQSIEAYRAFCDGGWHGMAAPLEKGGQDLPWSVVQSCWEMWSAANMSWSLAPMLTQGAIEAILHHASEDLKDRFLPKLVSGEWTGSMNITEADAGSELNNIRAKAINMGDHYAITGEKIYISFGDHNLTDNILHLVLARVEGAPAGNKGLSLFLVPKFMVDENGEMTGEANDVYCARVEHKVGIHGSPSCTMVFGEKGGAIGYLVGQQNYGLKYMFTMMNNARLSVGIQGVGLIERSYQTARDYARTRIQGRNTDGERCAIIEHADIRRMLLDMQSHVQAMRALILDIAYSMDMAIRHENHAARNWAQKRVDLMTPVVKAWCTEEAIRLTSVGIQIHGGAGYVEQSHVAQQWRDARATTIYEGTTGIQALDFLKRKILLDEGEAFDHFMDEFQALINRLNQYKTVPLSSIRKHLAAGIDALDRSVDIILDRHANDDKMIIVSSTALVELMGIVASGSMLARAAIIAHEGKTSLSDEQAQAKIAIAQYFAEHVLTKAPGLHARIREGDRAVMEFPNDQF